jgi:hypothetical protein
VDLVEAGVEGLRRVEAADDGLLVAGEAASGIVLDGL